MCVVILWGCSSTTLIHPVSSQDGISYSEFNQEMQSSQVNIELSDRRSFIAREIHVTSDSTRFLDVRTDIRVTIPTLHIKEVTVQDHPAGRSRGLLFGAAVGGLVGIGTVTGFGLVGTRWTELWNYAFGGGAAVLGVLVGGLAGGAIGSAAGYTRNFVIAGDSLRAK
jgi:hypothetical protein